MEKNLIEINNTTLEIKEYQGQKVIIFKNIDNVHGRPDGTARRRFNNNKKRFIEDIDFFRVKCSKVRSFFGQTPPNGFNPEVDIIFITESRYLMLVKPFRNDLAWEIQRKLVPACLRNIDSDVFIDF